jgi:hypothetical protein
LAACGEFHKFASTVEISVAPNAIGIRLLFGGTLVLVVVVVVAFFVFFCVVVVVVRLADDVGGFLKRFFSNVPVVVRRFPICKAVGKAAVNNDDDDGADNDDTFFFLYLRFAVGSAVPSLPDRDGGPLLALDGAMLVVCIPLLSVNLLVW